jgi:hypothetical protein
MSVFTDARSSCLWRRTFANSGLLSRRLKPPPRMQSLLPIKNASRALLPRFPARDFLQKPEGHSFLPDPFSIVDCNKDSCCRRGLVNDAFICFDHYQLIRGPARRPRQSVAQLICSPSQPGCLSKFCSAKRLKVSAQSTHPLPPRNHNTIRILHRLRSSYSSPTSSS